MTAVLFSLYLNDVIRVYVLSYFVILTEERMFNITVLKCVAISIINDLYFVIVVKMFIIISTLSTIYG